MSANVTIQTVETTVEIQQSNGGNVDQVIIVNTNALQGIPGLDGTSNGYETQGETTYTEASPLVIEADQTITLPLSIFSIGIDALQSAFAGHDFIDGTSNTIAARADDDTFIVRLTCQGQSDIARNKLKARFDIGGTQGVIASGSDDFHPQAETPDILTIVSPQFSKQTYIDNGATVTLTAYGRCELWDFNFAFFPLSNTP